jgi:two-component system, cell cycle sensor histidine kinase and response regulator CckA
MGFFSKFQNNSGDGNENAAIVPDVNGVDAESDAVDLSALIAPPPAAPVAPRVQPAARQTGDAGGPPPLDAQMLRTLMDGLPDSIYFKDTESRFIRVSAAFAKKHCPNGDAAFAAGKNDFDFFSPDHAQKAFDEEQAVIRTGKPLVGIEQKETWPDGMVTWARVSKFPLYGADGAIIGTWGISRDITDHKRARDELKSSEEQLRHAQKMEAFGQLAGGIAHDFNNLLGIILGSAQLLEADLRDAGAECKENIDLVIDTAKRASDLTAQLLTFARKGNVKIVRLEMHEVIHSAAGLLKHTIDKRIRIVERLAAPDSTIMGDYAQLQYALVNLALNARDAMIEGGTLTFTTDIVGPKEEHTGSPDGAARPLRYLRLRVSDTGHGMSEATKARAFEPFFTTKPPGKGTGLGLASVFGTIRKHNGFIELESELDKGTTFTLFLPLVITPDSERPPENFPTPCVEKRSGTLLVAEDEENLRAILGHFLEKLGYTVVACNDGVEAVDYYKKNTERIDALIIDMIMPRMGGPECIKKLKQINPRARIIVSSGYSMATDTQMIITRGIVGYIQKPYQIDEITKTLAAVLAGKQAPPPGINAAPAV